MAATWLAIFLMLALSSIYCIVSHPSPEMWFQGLFPSSVCLANARTNTFYGIMFDAGSTGTRIHIYTFVQKNPGKQPPELDGEIFESVKPGLSAYVDQPEKGAETVKGLLKMAKEAVPRSHWKETPVVLKATAGLRLLPEPKAQALLSEVREVFEESPFLVPNNSVSIMDGSSEGGSWEGGSGTYKLYTHSYLGFGLKAARLATLGALEMKAVDGQMFRSSCLPKRLEAEWHFGGVRYQYGGNREGETGFEPCYSEVVKVVQGKLHQPDEIRRRSFYAFSYYYDRAVDTDLIDYEKGGVLEVRDFERKAKEVCDNMDRYTSASPFLCMDLSYITALLKEGFGFGDNTLLQLTKKVNNIETSWALGATFHLLQSLGLSH
uniref:nucleoside diphosphate phosphatase n=1 Tax=Terrapene triunguis TaxID=2587831 RepID=A0A674J8B3_9SAUR